MLLPISCKVSKGIPIPQHSQHSNHKDAHIKKQRSVLYIKQVVIQATDEIVGTPTMHLGAHSPVPNR